MNELKTETGYLIKGPNGYLRGSGGRYGSGGWKLYKTKGAAERRISNRIGQNGYSVIRAKITITEEPTP